MSRASTAVRAVTGLVLAGGLAALVSAVSSETSEHSPSSFFGN